MFILSVCFGPNGTIWGLMFKSREAADKAAVALNAEETVIDDFGQEACIKKSDIHGILLEDQDQSALAIEQRELHNLRLRGKIMQRAGADPMIRAAMSGMGAMQVPPILNPMGNGRFPQ